LSNLSKLAKDILIQKYNYWKKALSQDAIENNFFNIYSTIDLIDFSFDATIFDSVFSSVYVAVNFGIPFTDIPVFNTCYDVNMPSPEDFSKGKLLDVTQVNCLDKYPIIGGWLTDLKLYTSTHFSPNVAGSSVGKAYYDVSYYGYSYYDPMDFYDLIRSTALKESKRSSSHLTASAVLKSFMKVLGISRDMVEYIHVVFQALSWVRSGAAMSEYSWSDRSVVQEELPGSIEVKTRNLDGEELTIKADAVTDLQGGSYSDVALSDISIVTDGKVPEVEDVPESSKRAEVAIADLISREAKSRAELTPLLVANYQTAEERTDFNKSRRADVYGAMRVSYHRIKSVVERVVGDKPLFIRNQYNVAAQQLFSRLTRYGGWGYEAFRSLTLDQLRDQWVEEWSEKGLDRDVLEGLFDVVYQEIRRLAPIRAAAKIGTVSRYMG